MDSRPGITPSPHPPNWPDCDPDDPTPPPTTEELVSEEGHHIPLPSRPYSPGELFRPACPIERCATICDHDALYCAECGARLYLISSGKYQRVA